MAEWLRFFFFAVSGLCIAIVDFRVKRIPNILLLVLAGALLCIDFLLEKDAMPYRLLTGFGAYLLFYSVYRFRGGLGFGDVKFAGVIGYFLGPWCVINGLLYGVLLGLMYWFFGNLIFHWGKGHRFAFGPWLSCGAVAAALVHQGTL